MSNKTNDNNTRTPREAQQSENMRSPTVPIISPQSHPVNFSIPGSSNSATVAAHSIPSTSRNVPNAPENRKRKGTASSTEDEPQKKRRGKQPRQDWKQFVIKDKLENVCVVPKVRQAIIEVVNYLTPLLRLTKYCF